MTEHFEKDFSSFRRSAAKLGIVPESRISSISVASHLPSNSLQKRMHLD
jgi:hypothetical protein